MEHFVERLAGGNAEVSRLDSGAFDQVVGNEVFRLVGMSHVGLIPAVVAVFDLGAFDGFDAEAEFLHGGFESSERD